MRHRIPGAPGLALAPCQIDGKFPLLPGTCRLFHHNTRKGGGEDPQSYECSLAKDVRHYPQRFDIIQGGGGIQTSRRIVPALDTRPGGHHFCDADPLSFPARDSANERVFRVRNVEHAKQRILNLTIKLFTCNAWEATTGTRRFSSRVILALRRNEGSLTWTMRMPAFAQPLKSRCEYHLSR